MLADVQGIVIRVPSFPRLLRLILEDAGFRVVSAYLPDLKQGRQRPGALLAQHDARVIVWDVAIPYEDNWQFFQSVVRSPAAQGRRFVLTTTNKRALEALVGPAEAHELVGKPFDLDQLVGAVRRALE